MSRAVVRVLTKALNEIETRGWCRGPSDGLDTPCCAVTAIARHMPIGGVSVLLDSITLVSKAAGAIGDLVEWNDRKTRRKSEVVGAFKKAIKLASKPVAKKAKPKTKK